MGTFLFLFIAHNNHEKVYIEFGLFISMLIFGKISGAHMNPSLTIALMIFRNLSILDGIYYILFQFFGGFLGNLLIKEYVFQYLLIIKLQIYLWNIKIILYSKYLLVNLYVDQFLCFLSYHKILEKLK